MGVLARFGMLFLGLLAIVPAMALAQPADLPISPATTDTYPPGVKVTGKGARAVYANARGQVLYGMDMRTVLRWSPNAAHYCKGECAKQWEPLLAPKDSVVNIRFPDGPGRPRPDGTRNPDSAKFLVNQSAPDWTVIAGPEGPQWVYKGWHMVYVRRGSRRGDTSFDGSGELTWNTLKHVPPIPKIAAPPEVRAAFADGAYILTDKAGQILVTGTCADCALLPAALASRGVGEWTVGVEGDRPHWQWRSKPVFAVSRDSVPPHATPIRPEAKP